MNDVEAEINEMLKSIELSEKVQETEEQTPPVSESETPEPSAVVEQTEIEKEVVAEEPASQSEESVVSQETIPPESVTPEVPATPDPRDQKIAELEAKLAELTQAIKSAEKPADPEPIETRDFISDDEDLDELTRDPKALNAKLNQVYQQGMHDTKNAIFKELPNIVAQQVDIINALTRARDNFYAENTDLKPFGKVVETVYAELMAKNPTKTIDQLMKETAAETRKKLNLPGPKPKQRQPPPVLPNKGKSAGKVVSIDNKSKGIINELEEMDKVLNS